MYLKIMQSNFLNFLLLILVNIPFIESYNSSIILTVKN